MSRGAVDDELRERRLSAILAADVVGYSKLMGADEVETLSALRRHRRELIDPTITSHRGRIVKTTGDGMLVEFASAVDAVRCAVDVQRGMAERNEAVSPEKRIEFRIGINVGDIIGVGDDIYGDGVNVAARLEAMSKPGDIYVSRTVRDPVRDKLVFSFEDLGEISAKNIARPIHVFRVRHDTEAGREKIVSPLVVRRLVIAVIAVLVVVAAGAGAWSWHPRASGAVPPPLSLVVLPFDDQSGVSTDKTIIETINEDLPLFLAGFSGFKVIAGNALRAGDGKPLDPKRAGEELGVRYALSGTARKAEGTPHVDVELISTETGARLWADRYEVGDGEAGQGADRIATQIVSDAGQAIVEIDAARGVRERPDNPTAQDVLLQARALSSRPSSPERQKQLIALYERAAALNPTSAFALAGLAEALLDSNAFAREDPQAPARQRRASDLITRAELLEPRDGKVVAVRVYLLMNQNRCAELIPAATRAIDDNPALPLVRYGLHQWLGICLQRDGRAAEAIPMFEQSIRDNPRHPQNFVRFYSIGYALAFLGRYDEAVTWLRKSLASNPSNSIQRRGNMLAAIAATLALGGHTDEAPAEAAETTRLWPTLTARSYFLLASGSPIYEAQVNQLRDGLRRAGIRDHANEDEDFGLASDKVLHTDYEARTPTTVPGARTIGTHDLASMLGQRKSLVIDASIPWGQSVPGAIGLWGVGVGGSITDEYQDRLGRKMQELTHGDQKSPVVVMGWNAERYQGRNLALRLVALGYENVYWYRGGREAWEVAGLPETALVMQDW
jgi:class 3 adenylate cyclase/TolB-like protein